MDRRPSSTRLCAGKRRGAQAYVWLGDAQHEQPQCVHPQEKLSRCIGVLAGMPIGNGRKCAPETRHMRQGKTEAIGQAVSKQVPANLIVFFLHRKYLFESIIYLDRARAVVCNCDHVVDIVAIRSRTFGDTLRAACSSSRKAFTTTSDPT